MKTPFSQFWKSRKDRDELLEKQNELKLTPSQLSSLLTDGDVRGSLQESRAVSLLPPVGTEVFRRFTPDSLEQIDKCHDSKNKQVEEDYSLKPADELESGQSLPFVLGAPPPELQNVPLEDLDHFYQSQKTFVVVSKKNIVSRFNAASSCFYFSPFSLFRRVAIKILNHNVFVALVLVTLLVNMVVMPPFDSPRHIPECVFLSVYSVEALLKILSKGFCLGPFTYLRDSWDRLDFFIVVTGLLTVLLKVTWMVVLRPLRVLKILGLFTGSRRFMRSFGRSVKSLVDVLLVSLCVLSIFSVIGTQLFMGSLRNKCVRNPLGSNSTGFMNLTNNTELDFKSYINSPAHFYFWPQNLDALLCGNSSDAGSCPDGYICLRTDTSPNYGFTNFDSFGWSFLSTFRLMMRDFWENLAQLTMRANGKSTFIYFVLALFVCSFSLLGLVVATFTIIFTEQNQDELKEAQEKQKDFARIVAALKDKTDEEADEENKDSRKTCCLSCLRVVCGCDCCSCWIKVKSGLQVFVLDPFFDLAIIICIILNVCFMSMTHYPMTFDFLLRLAFVEWTFSLIFLLEVVLKMLALGPFAFFQVRWHVFDTFLVVLSILDFVVADISELLILRVLRLCRWWPCFLKWLRLVGASLRSLWSVTLSVVLTALFFSSFGMYLFGPDYQMNSCRLTQNCGLPRWHMSDFFHSFMLVTRALCGEWVETLWDCLEVSGGFKCGVFYITLLLAGNLLVVSLFLSLLMKWISDKLDPKDEEKMQTLKKRITRLCGVKQEETKEGPTRSEEQEGVALTCVTPEQTELQDGDNGHQQQTLEMVEEDEESPENCCCDKCGSCSPCSDQAQGCGRVWANIRKSCFSIVQHKYFNNFILFIVLISTATLVFEDIYLDSRPALKAALGYIDEVITFLFLLEALFKWVGYGFKRYFRDGWCWLDFIVTLACGLSVVSQTIVWVPSVQSLKSLRPLRILPHITGTKLSVVALLRLVPSLIDVLLVGLTVWLVFGVIGVHMFAGKFFYCFNETSEEYFLPEEVSNKTQCLLLINDNVTDVHWKNLLINFDSITIAYLSLFQMATFKGWLDILYAASDRTFEEDVPNYEEHLYTYLYFLAFLLFGCFFTFNLILKVIFEAYHDQRDQAGGTHLFLTQKQLKSYNAKKHSSNRATPIARPQARLRGLVFDLVTRLSFEMVMLVVICVSVLLVGIEYFDLSEKSWMVLYWMHFVLVQIFTIEVALKTFAFRRHYFEDYLNVVDFVVTVASIVTLTLGEWMTYYYVPADLMVLLRLGRFSRVVHLVPGLRRFRLLFKSFTMSLPAVFNLGLVLLILMLVYSSFGTFHFSRVKKAAMIDDQTNFETFVNSFICMVTVTTWAGWDGLLLPVVSAAPDCDPREDCGHAATGVAFFVSYLCLSSYLVLMMFVVLLVEMLNAFAEASGDPLSDHTLQMFFNTWRKLDPEASHFIQRSQFPDLCERLKEPLRILKPHSIERSLPEETLHCRDVLLALAVQTSGAAADKDALEARIEEKYATFMPRPPQTSSEPSRWSQMKQEVDETEVSGQMVEN